MGPARDTPGRVIVASRATRRLATQPASPKQACTNQAPSSSSMATGTVRASPDRRPRTVSSTFGAPVGTASPPHSRRSPSSGTRRGRSRATFRSGTRWVNPSFNSSSGPNGADRDILGERAVRAAPRPFACTTSGAGPRHRPAATHGSRRSQAPALPACSGVRVLTKGALSRGREDEMARSELRSGRGMSAGTAYRIRTGDLRLERAVS